MRAVHEDALICDFAQYYHIYDLDSVDVRTAATLACGLPADSRTLKEKTGKNIGLDIILQASILDTARSIEYAVFQSHTKKKLQRPQPVLKKLLGTEKEDSKKDEVRGFRTAEEFEAARNSFMREE